MSLIKELQESVAKAGKRALEEESRKIAQAQAEYDAALKQAKKEAPAIAKLVLERVKEGASNGETRVRVPILWRKPAHFSVDALKVQVAVTLLEKKGLKAVSYFEHEWKTDGDNGWNEDEYGISVWGW